uniref:Uncharacterized protein n=1 Tax=Sparus aurata TaxID=8175 RepID=A0A671Y530_SPAAU
IHTEASETRITAGFNLRLQFYQQLMIQHEKGEGNINRDASLSLHTQKPPAYIFNDNIWFPVGVRLLHQSSERRAELVCPPRRESSSCSPLPRRTTPASSETESRLPGRSGRRRTVLSSLVPCCSMFYN